MQSYQVKVLPRNSFLYGGSGVTAGTVSGGSVLRVKNDRFGEPIHLKVVSQPPAQPEVTTDIGMLAADQALTVDLKFVLRVEANTLADNLASIVSCVVDTLPTS